MPLSEPARAHTHHRTWCEVLTNVVVSPNDVVTWPNHRVTRVDERSTNARYRRFFYSCHTSHRERCVQLVLQYTDRPWWTVEDAARLLRVNVHTLYRACAADDFPHKRHSFGIRIPCEALLLTPKPETYSRNYHVADLADPEQLAFDYGAPLIPVRTYRNSDQPVRPGDYELALSAGRRWRNSDKYH